MKQHEILPFYMTYPISPAQFDDKEMMRDLEYLQELYPECAKILQNEINKAINIYDYRGGIIYDEYPDRIRLYQLAKQIVDIMKKNKKEYRSNRQFLSLLEWDGLDDFVVILLFYEILKRRHQEKNGYYLF